MKITVAKSAGFCFGVRRAVNLVFEEAEKSHSVRTLGPIIHNPQIVGQLKEKGVEIVESVDECEQASVLVIRSHGVGADIYDEINERKLKFLDATCPFVSKIHKTVQEESQKGRIILIAGDENHPEVKGIIGHCKGEYYAFKTAKDIEQILKNIIDLHEKQFSMVAQTTFNTIEWGFCVENAKKVCTNLAIFDTICSATETRQQEAIKLAKQSDVMVVVGGAQSSNTKKLEEVCKPYCRTVLVESAEQLKDFDFSGAKLIGVTAGASTPAFIIKEVQETMSEILMNNNEEELSFEEMLEQSFKSTYTGEKVTGTVVGYTPTEVQVEIGTKQTGYVPLHELTDDPNAKVEDLVKKGDTLTLQVLRVNDVEGTIMLSKKRIDAAAGLEKIEAAAENNETLTGIVREVVKGGVVAVCNGVKIFIPASQATASKDEPLENLLKKEVSFKILEMNRGRRRAVGSIRAVLREERKALEDKFWESVEVGQTYKGAVKSLTSYGAFVDLGGVDGMVHISELSWNRIKHPSEVVNVGDVVEVYVKDIDAENRKISLGYKKAEDNPWEILKRDYPVGSTVDVKIVSMTTFGAFAQIIPGIDGLIHISQISTERINKPQDVLEIGQEVKAKLIEVDFDKKRVSLSIRALLEEQDEAAEDAE